MHSGTEQNYHVSLGNDTLYKHQPLTKKMNKRAICTQTVAAHYDTSVFMGECFMAYILVQNDQMVEC